MVTTKEENPKNMTYSNKKMLVAFALITAALCISSAYAGRILSQGRSDRHLMLHWSKNAKPDSFDAQIRNGAVVGMSAVSKDGSRLSLKQQNKPTCATSCPEGQKLTCWEDDEQQMSICVCGSSGGGRGLFRLYGDANGDGGDTNGN
jgi:hypothetical protein